MTKEEKLKLEWQLHSKSKQITKLQKQLSDTFLLLYKERDSNVEMQSKLKQLQLEDEEHKKRIHHLLKLLQPTHEEITLAHGMKPFGVASYFPKQQQSKNKENNINFQNSSSSRKTKDASVKYKNLYKTTNSNTSTLNNNNSSRSNRGSASNTNRSSKSSLGNVSASKINYKQKSNGLPSHVNYIKPGSVKLRTIYLPSDNSDYLNMKVNALQAEIHELKQLNLERESFLCKDRTEAYDQLMKLRDEYDSQMDELSTQLQILSKQHLYNMKEYLQFRRDSKQLILNLKLQSFKNKSEKSQIERECAKTVERAVYESKKFQRKMGDETQNIVHEYRRQNMEKDCQIQMMNEQLKENKDTFIYRLNQMKNKLSLLTKRNYQLTKQRKYEKQGFNNDIKQLKMKMKKLDEWITMESAAGILSQNLKNQIDQVQSRLEQLTRSVQK